MRPQLLAAAALVHFGCSKPAPTLHEASAQPAGSMSPPPFGAPPMVWPQQAKSDEELRRFGMSPEWHDLLHERMKIAVAIEEWPTDGESYIDVYAYLYNQHFREWRQVFAVKLRGAGGVRLEHDRESGLLQVVGTANNDFDGKALFTFDLDAVHDDG